MATTSAAAMEAVAATYLSRTTDTRLAVDAVAMAAFNEKKWVWIPDGTGGFIAAHILKEGLPNDTILVKGNDDKVSFYLYLFELGKTLTQDKKKEYTVNINDTEKMNPPKFDKVEDMADLAYLNRPSVVHNLRLRYLSNLIYTYSGLFLVAVNPYHRLPIYSEQVVSAYKNKKRVEMPPHVYAITDQAYRDMLQDRENQSILITGESGAGKTENTKKAIQYLAYIAGEKSSHNQGMGRLEQQILQANPILESFGNAQTIRNNNSSRFGKFVRIEFNAAGAISGANIERYLLEKSRVTHQTSKERNYHIFYQLLKGGSEELKKQLLIDGSNLNAYQFIKASNKNIDGVDDGADFKSLQESMSVMGFSTEEQTDMFRSIAAILLMGNLTSVPDREGMATVTDALPYEKVCHVLGIPVEQFIKALTKPKILAGRDWVTQSKTPEQLASNVEALARATYERMFGKLVDRINSALDQPSARTTFIGVLDIAGFEIFETNGFEQLCINYTNERLQQFFNHHMFILEQEEYKREGIEWKFIDFGLDLQPTIDLIEKANPIGILSLLDEESVMPKASDKTFIDKLHGLWKGKSPKYEAMKFAGDGFLIQHYAGKVEYRTQNWLDKNRDPLNEAVTRLLANSADKFIGSLFSDYAGDADPSLAAAGGANGNAAGFAAARAAAGASGGGKSGIVKKGAFRTVAQKHKEQLVSLMSQLYSTQPHFVRCIIPNEEKKPGKLNVPLVLDQLNCNGVLEGIRICRAGFPNRLPFAEFRQRYEILCPGVIPKGFMDGRKATQTILEQLALDPNQYRLGSSKVFFKAGVLAEMEEIRDVKLGKIITGFQAQCRGFLARKQHRRRLDQYKAILHIQRNARLYIKLREWSWWKLYTKVKPLLQVGRMDEEIRRRDENISDLRSQVTRANADRDSLEATRAAIEAEKRQYEELLKSEQAAAADQAVILQRAQLRLAGLQEEVEKFNAEYADLEKSYADVSSAKVRLQVEHKDVVDQLTEERQLVERLEKERAAKEARVKQLEAEMAAGSAQLAAIEIEKKSLLQQVADYERDVMSGTEKEAELLKQKKRLEALLHDSEEKASRLESDLSTANSKRQSLESELSATKSTLGDLQKVRADLELLVKKKESELESVNAQLAAESVERESAEKSRRDLQARLAALDDQFQSEKAEKERFNKLYKKAQDEFEALQHDLENKTDQESKDQEVRRLRESELAGLKAQLVALQQEQEELKRKSAAAAAQARKEYEVLIEERDGLGKQRTAFEKKSVELESEVNEMQDAKNKMEKIKRQLDMDLSTAKARSKELEDAVTELRSTRDAIEKQLAAAAARADEGDGKNDRLEKERSTLLKQLETAREELKEEERKRSLVEAQRKKLQSDLAALQEKVDADEVAMADIQRRLQAKAQEFDVLKDQYAKDATERGAVLEEARKKLEREMADLRHKLEESEQQMASMEKLKIRLTTEVEDLRLENDRQHALTRQAERLQKQTESEVAALNAVIDNERRQREQADAKARSLQGTLDSMQMQLDEKKEAVAALQRSKGAIESEYRSLVNEIGEGGKNVHELDRMKKKLESRIEELTAQLEEEEASRGKAEEARRRLEEQFAEHRSKTEQDLLAREAQHEEARESFRREINEMGMLLEDAQAAKTQLQNAKKKLEADIADLTSKQDTTDKNKTDLEKSKKKTEQLLKDVQAKLDAADQKCKGLEEMAQRHEKKANSLSSEKEELERLLEVSERERKRFEKRSEELLAELEGGEGGSKAQLLEAKKKLDKELSRLRDELDHQQQEYLSLQSKQRDVSDTDAARGKFKEEYEEKIERLEGHTRALMAEKRLAQQEYEQTRRDIEAADRRSNMREAEIAQLKAQLDQEIAAKNEEQAQRRKLAADFKDMLNKLEMEASKSTELAESLAMFKARADQAISRYETSEMARLKAEKAEGSLRLQVKDMEETIIELGTNKKIAEDRVRALELELREVTERAEEDAAELTDAQMARRKLTHEGRGGPRAPQLEPAQG
ncbi:P-loop containing nucleoside triphosphate hydrolase protein [Blastocladiella britannica]|nr:P-loop containing nucleoside triphosphate hydrolase protein [Blastocladiella britannica]